VNVRVSREMAQSLLAGRGVPKKQTARIFDSLEGKPDAELIHWDLILLAGLARAQGILEGGDETYRCTEKTQRRANKEAKEKTEEPHKTEIARIIRRDPKAKVASVFAKLDEAKIPLVWLGDPINHVNGWKDLAGEPAYIMLVQRERKKFAEIKGAKTWKRLTEDERRKRAENDK
jgi:hypothetical protein